PRTLEFGGQFGRAIMKRRKILKIAAMSLLALGWFPCSAAAQSIKEQLVGAWTFVSALDVHPDGRKDDRWGANPKGVFIFDKSGRYAQFISRSDLPQVEGGRPDKGTPDENKAILSGLVASFGTYTVDESNKTVTTKVEGGAFPTYRGRAEARDTVDHRRRAEIHQPGDTNGHEGRGQLEAGEVAGRNRSRIRISHATTPI